MEMVTLEVIKTMVYFSGCIDLGSRAVKRRGIWVHALMWWISVGLTLL